MITSRLKTDLEDFTKAIKLLTYYGCCKPDGIEIKKLIAITSFKSSLHLSRLRYSYEYCDCFLYGSIVSQLNAENLATFEFKIEQPYECIVTVEYGITAHKAELRFGMYDWSEGEAALVLDKVMAEGVFDPCIGSQKWVSFIP
jgi:hypothetical protein